MKQKKTANSKKERQIDLEKENHNNLDHQSSN